MILIIVHVTHMYIAIKSGGEISMLCIQRVADSPEVPVWPEKYTFHLPLQLSLAFHDKCIAKEVQPKQQWNVLICIADFCKHIIPN